MNLADITTKCYILALIIRDDGERLLLGDGAYEFKDSQQHFIANTYANDVVELQGTDGQMLAGQVRRTATQTFSGYIGDATFSKQRIEAARRDFLMFFRKKHYYTAVYVFSDGTAIQRDRGYIVNAPSVPELYQRFPEWSVGLNFEDPNYYEYAEDDLGQEIAAHKVELELELSTAMSGGLIWDGDGAVSDDLSYVGTEIPGEGKNFQLANTGTATLKSAELLGDAEQTTYSGKNLCSSTEIPSGAFVYFYFPKSAITAGAYRLSAILNDSTSNNTLGLMIDGTSVSIGATMTGSANQRATSGFNLSESIVQQIQSATTVFLRLYKSGGGFSSVTEAQLEKGTSVTTYEPYVGGTPAPNPSFPQAVNTVTGEQTVKIEGKNLFDGVFVVGAINGNTGANVTNTSYIRADNYIKVEPQTIYSISSDNTAIASWFIYEYKADKTYNMTSNKSIANGSSWTTFEETEYIRFRPNANITNAPLTTQAQLELGSTATTYEPYQAQTKPVNLGKNLIESSTKDGNLLFLNGETSQTDFVFPAGTYTVQYKNDSYNCSTYMRTSSTSATSLGQNKIITFTATEQFALWFYRSGMTENEIYDIQLELGSQATSYSAYFTPIELAKIGNYQDRIYKTNGKWYVEKQVGKVVLDGTESWWISSGTLYASFIADYATSGNTPISDHFVGQSNITGAGDVIDNRIAFNNSTQYNYRFYIRCTSKFASVSDLTTWLASNPTTVYYALATPTTTEITNSELVGQLERLRHARTYADTTNFSITATSPNLPAFLKVVAFGDDAIPQGGYVWEDGGTGGATTITVDGVDNAQPIWTVVGPATNPSLTNITTGESIQWTGVVPNGQTLVVNMADMTASLSGANVFEFISGSWITLQAGNNRVSYSATAATGIATLEWNGVVG